MWQAAPHTITAPPPGAPRRPPSLQRLDLKPPRLPPVARAHSLALPIGRAPLAGRRAAPGGFIRDSEPDRPRDRCFFSSGASEAPSVSAARPPDAVQAP